MNEFNNLVNAIKSIMEANTTFDIYAARKIVQQPLFLTLSSSA